MATIKEKMRKIIEGQPEDASYEEIMRELAFERMIVRGLENSRKSHVISNEEMEHRIRSWQRLRWTFEAETWLRDIYDYIAQDNPAAAARVVEGIYEKSQVLSQFPDIGYIYRSENEGEIRILLYGHYRIAYLHLKEEDVIDVLGVFHGALNIEKYFP